ncbi:MAG: hypothetical protein JWO77_487 [Ilumatobacteraceae bacterium]|nr:hypothetical protein [Ilumatobacteraceae bacterium]
MDDDLRVADAPSTGAFIHAPVVTSTAPQAEPIEPAAQPIEPGGAEVGPVTPVAPRRERAWVRRIGVALVVLIAGAATALQVQAARVREEVAAAETTQRIAELDEETARIRLASVGDRVDLAERNQADAEGVLDGSREAMTAQGLEEATLHDAQVAKAGQVKDLRSQVKAVAAAIATQKRLQPAADACLFDLLRGLGSSSARDTEECRTVASLAGQG